MGFYDCVVVLTGFGFWFVDFVFVVCVVVCAFLLKFGLGC